MYMFNLSKKEKRIYLDYASATPVSEEALLAMKPYFSSKFWNPSAIYEEGVEARKAVSEARTKIAQVISSQPEEIIFTSSGTESDNLAVLGVFEASSPKDRAHFITSKIEHSALIEAFVEVERRGGKVSKIGVGPEGIVDPKDIAAEVTSETVLVSISYANGEIGSIQPIKEIAKIIRDEKNKRVVTENPRPIYLHCDASQAANYLDLNVEKLGVDLLTLDGSKIYGPKGIGILFVKKGTRLHPMIHGGGQEMGLRSGTENVPSIVGIAEALEIVQKEKEKESARMGDLQKYFLEGIKKIVPNFELNGSLEKRLPNNINICVPFLDSEFAVIRLDREGVACSSSSACRNLKDNSSSYVVAALGERKERECTDSSVRFSMGRHTTKKEIDRVLKILKELALG